jgi:hypothetical protein
MAAAASPSLEPIGAILQCPSSSFRHSRPNPARCVTDFAAGADASVLSAWLDIVAQDISPELDDDEF